MNWGFNMSTLKTVRLPDDLVEYIESQEGENFSQKLISIVLVYQEAAGEQEELRKYINDNYKQKSQELEALTNKINVIREVLGA